MIDVHTFRQYCHEAIALQQRFPRGPQSPMTPEEYREYNSFMETKSIDMMEYIRTHPRYQLEQHSNKYFITFTYNPSTEREAFIPAVIKQLQREIHLHVHYCIEHEDTNIHVHALVESQQGVSLTADRYKSHARKHGHVRVDHIKQNNGIEQYMEKENKPIFLK